MAMLISTDGVMREESSAIARENGRKQNSVTIVVTEFQAFGGGERIRTTEARRNRFTVCPLWPLGNSPIFWINHLSL